MHPRSPRARRRLLVAAIAATLVAVAVGVVALLPGAPSDDPEVFHGPADVVQAGPTAVSTARRAAITDSLRRFMAAGLARGDLGEAWSLSSPSLRRTTDRATWLAGNVPFVEYHARTFGPDAWDVVESRPREVVLDLFVQPQRGSKQGPATFTFDVRLVDRRWIVESVYASVLFSAEGERPGVVAANDFTAPGAADPRANATARLSAWWLLLPVVGAGVLLALLVLAVRHGRRRTAV